MAGDRAGIHQFARAGWHRPAAPRRSGVAVRGEQVRRGFLPVETGSRVAVAHHRRHQLLGWTVAERVAAPRLEGEPGLRGTGAQQGNAVEGAGQGLGNGNDGAAHGLPGTNDVRPGCQRRSTRRSILQPAQRRRDTGVAGRRHHLQGDLLRLQRHMRRFPGGEAALHGTEVVNGDHRQAIAGVMGRLAVIPRVVVDIEIAPRIPAAGEQEQ